MPRLIATEPGPPLDLAGFVDAVEAAGFDPADEASFVSVAPLLRRLACNRRFLGDRLLREIEAGCGDQARANRYNAQVVMLDRRERWFVRANIWPGARDPAVRTNGLGPFFYGLPHDHNFSFLTVGYFGPGYESDHWEVDPQAITGLPGEAVTLRALGRQRLTAGQVMLYRAHRDVHAQHPPASLSVTLNLMQATPGLARRAQYRFDPDRGTIAERLGQTAMEALLPLAARLGGADGRALLAELADRHPSGRIRFGAIAALADSEVEPAGAERLVRGARDGDALVAGLCTQAIATRTAGSAWIGATTPP
ncbi:transposase [Sphingomonas sp. 1P06PA]|uniref:transposase n=1 Tax=Sphingomonas sp. 1P06PA TaxID=554121 RepID=UPI0039A69829